MGDELYTTSPMDMPVCMTSRLLLLVLHAVIQFRACHTPGKLVPLPSSSISSRLGHSEDKACFASPHQRF